MSAVCKFGRFPRERAATEDPKLEEERKLARDIRRALDAERLPPAFVSELEAMKDKVEEDGLEEEKRRWEIWTQELMAAVRRFGRWPVQKKGAQHAEERDLAKHAHNALSSGRLTPADEAELSEMRWMPRRELEALALDMNAMQA